MWKIMTVEIIDYSLLYLILPNDDIEIDFDY